MDCISEYNNGQWKDTTSSLNDFLVIEYQIFTTINSTIHKGTYLTTTPVTVKEIKRSDSKERVVQNELDVLTRLPEHPNISKYYTAFRTKRKDVYCLRIRTRI